MSFTERVDEMTMLAAAPTTTFPSSTNMIVKNAPRRHHATVTVRSDPCLDEPDGGSSAPVRMIRDRRDRPAARPGRDDAAGATNENDGPRIAARRLVTHGAGAAFELVREVDAEILELGVKERRDADLADFDDEGRRLEASESNPSLTQLESEATDARGEERDVCGRSQVDYDGPIGGGSIDESSDDLSSLLSILHSTWKHSAVASPRNNDDALTPFITEDASSCIAQPATSYNFKPQSHIITHKQIGDHPDGLSENTDYFLSTPQIPSKRQVTELDHEALWRRKVNFRSASFDRRLNESAQFAEAVGEEPDSLLLKKIIDEDSSSYFDSDDIGEVGVNLILNKDEAVVEGGLHEDYQDAERREDIPSERLVGGPLQENPEPTSVATDLDQMSLMDDQPRLQRRGELPLLPTFEKGVVDSAPNTPHPSPLKPKLIMSRSCPPSSASYHPPVYVDWKFISQHSLGPTLGRNDGCYKSNAPASSSGEADFFYRGIHANPPEITKRGMSRGNYAQLHRKAWLEVADKHHRYGKNLRMYYKHWEALGHPFLMFFDWLDSKGEAIGNPLPNLTEIPRPVLDSDTVLYVTNPERTASYALDIVVNPADGYAIILDQSGNPVDTGKEGWMFVLRDHVMYGSQKVIAPDSSMSSVGSRSDSPSSMATGQPRQRFHHSSFFGGKAVASAGIFLTDAQGRLTCFYPHSGHYRPGEAHVQRALFFFQQLGVELSSFRVDMQQIFKVSRKTAPKGGDTTAAEGGKSKGSKGEDKDTHITVEDGSRLQINVPGKHPQPPQLKKSKKVDNLHLMCGLEVACFLAHKALMIERDVFHQIHAIRRIPKESRSSVYTILSFMNN